ncbi:UDP-N-acetylenolpyruvoylglucosamine reductase [Candidatus Peregrinibacteria bacterium CG10_big_fil_rev_8_21_14_0_10_36_19]|nr:MAG: UDP-N-acetylenolpyruvoylglucosamine reductase [Candidatus Peregrinibacteria bacterium CG10_big_fil_rev_8_21_14_0_10_36_19]
MLDLKSQFPEVLQDESLANYCTFRVGGKADYFFKANTLNSLQNILKYAKEHQIPYFIIGKGSNVLFSDRGFRGLIIQLELKDITFHESSVTAQSGVITAVLINECIKNGYSGLEKWVGLPGTIGGAVYGNAGCNGLETKEILTEATILDPLTAETRTVKNTYFEFTYRHSKLKETGEILVDATFSLQKDVLTAEQQRAIMSEIQQFRLTKQPHGPSSGSFFKNPSPDKPAGLLIDQAGLKGTKIGDAQISEKHGNFFLNLGKATASDISQLAQKAQKEVYEKFQINLEPEVQILTETGKSKL